MSERRRFWEQAFCATLSLRTPDYSKILADAALVQWDKTWVIQQAPVPSVDAPEAPRVRFMVTTMQGDFDVVAIKGKSVTWLTTCETKLEADGLVDRLFGVVRELTPADAAREQAVQALVEAVDADLLDTIADSGERCESMDGFGSSTLKHLAYLKRAIPGK